MIPDRIYTPFFKVENHEWFSAKNRIANEQERPSRSITMYLHDMNDNPPIDIAQVGSLLPLLNHDKADVTATITETAVGTDRGQNFVYSLNASSPGWQGTDPFTELEIPNAPMDMLSLQMIERWLIALITVELKKTYMGEIKSPDEGQWWTKGSMDVYDTIRISVTGESKIKVLSIASKPNQVETVRASLFNIAVDNREPVGFKHHNEFEDINRMIRSAANEAGEKFLPKILYYSGTAPTKEADPNLQYKEALIVYNDFNQYQIDAMIETTLLLVADGDEDVYDVFENVMRILRLSVFANTMSSRKPFIQFLQRVASHLYYSDAKSFNTLIENNNPMRLDIAYTPTDSEDSLHKRFTRVIEALYDVIATNGQINDIESESFYAPKYV